MFICLKEVRTGDIFDCFPEMDNLHDPYAQGDKRAKCRWTSSDRFAEHIYSLFLELKDNITVLWKVYSPTKHRRQLGAVDVQTTFSIYCQLYHRKHHKWFFRRRSRRSVTIV